MNSTIAIAVHSSWSLWNTTPAISFRVVRSWPTMMSGSRTPNSVTDCPSSMTTTTAIVNMVHACTSPPRAFVTGMIATTTVNRPIVAKILASEPKLSRCFWSRVSAGSSDQYGMSLAVQDRLHSRYSSAKTATKLEPDRPRSVSYTHLRAHETDSYL